MHVPPVVQLTLPLAKIGVSTYVSPSKPSLGEPAAPIAVAVITPEATVTDVTRPDAPALTMPFEPLEQLVIADWS